MAAKLAAEKGLPVSPDLVHDHRQAAPTEPREKMKMAAR